MAGESAGAATSEVDVRTLFEQRRDTTRDKPAPEPVKEPTEKGEVASPATAPAKGSLPIDLAASEGVEGNLLDDDAFFATLRDAVSDEKPLGPRDDDDETGENQFFDQDAERGTSSLTRAGEPRPGAGPARRVRRRSRRRGRGFLSCRLPRAR